MTIEQPKRLTYTKRDLIGLHGEVTGYMEEFIERITDASEMNDGRLFITTIEALVDNLNFSVDNTFLELLLKKSRQRKNILYIAYGMNYEPSSVSPSSVDLTFSMLSGVAGVGGEAIPIYSRVQSTSGEDFLTVEAATILEGTASISDVPAVQGIRVENEVLTNAASGSPSQRYKISNAKTPHELIEVSVDGTQWSRIKDNFTSSDEDSRHYKLEFDEDDYTWVVFSDGVNGNIPAAGVQILATYITTDAGDGNVGAGTITTVLGTIASTVGVTNTYRSSGGAVSESNESIKRNAPIYSVSGGKSVTKNDYIALAQSQAGVYKAFAESGGGARTNVYILPDGGGPASTYLKTLVQASLDDNKMEGAIPVVDGLEDAYIFISVNVILKSTNTKKERARSKIKYATIDNLVYTKLTRGRGFTVSDLSGIYENIDDGEVVDFVDFTILSRIPRVEKSNAGGPDFSGRVNITSTVGYDTYLVTAVTTTTFTVSKNSIPQSTGGTIATQYISDDLEVSFTLGEPGDLMVVGDTWVFKTSKYADNIVLDPNEIMALEKDSDLKISVFYSDEYSIKDKAAI